MALRTTAVMLLLYAKYYKRELERERRLCQLLSVKQTQKSHDNQQNVYLVNQSKLYHFSVYHTQYTLK